MPGVEKEIKFTPSVDLEVSETFNKLACLGYVVVALALLYGISKYGFKKTTSGGKK